MRNNIPKYVHLECMDLSGKIMIVFGGNGDIGSDLIRNALSHNAKKIYATVHNRTNNISKLKKKYPKRLSITRLDIQNYEEVQNFVEKIKTVDIGINCVGIIDDSHIQNLSIESWNTVIKTNLTGMFNTSKCLFVKMKPRKKGNIINVTSIVGQKGAFGQVNYSSSKAGIIGLTKTLALDCAKYGIIVNGVAPGYINSKMIQRIPKLVLKKIIEDIPLKKVGKPQDVTNLIIFLASDYNKYITGEIINVDGGL